MIEEYYDAGGDAVHLDLGLEKEAFLGAAFSKVVPKLAPRILGGLGKAWRAGKAPVSKGYQAVAKKLAPVGQAVETGIGKGVGSVLGKPGEELTRSAIKGVPGQMARDAASFSALSAGIEGGVGALNAEEGQRGKAFLEGAGSGALSGAAMGGVMGGFGGVFKNLRRGSLNQAAQRQLAKNPQLSMFPKQEAASLAKKQLNRGFRGSVRDVFTGKGNLGRAGSAQNVAGGLGQFGAEWVAPAVVLPASLGGGNPFADTEQVRTASIAAMTNATEAPDESIVPKQLLTTLGGGAVTGIPIGIGIDALKKKPWYPSGTKGSLLARTGQTLGAGVGVLGGHYLGKLLFPKKEIKTEVEQKIEQLDFDKLMRYYKKPEEAQV